MFGRYIHTMVLRKRDDQNRNLGCKILKPNPVKLQGGPITANWLILILGRYLPNMFIWYYFSVGISYTMTKYYPQYRMKSCKLLAYTLTRSTSYFSSSESI